eukprot:983109-Prymnesium_polylepis.1
MASRGSRVTVRSQVLATWSAAAVVPPQPHRHAQHLQAHISIHTTAHHKPPNFDDAPPEMHSDSLSAHELSISAHARDGSSAPRHARGHAFTHTKGSIASAAKGCGGVGSCPPLRSY